MDFEAVSNLVAAKMAAYSAAAASLAQEKETRRKIRAEQADLATALKFAQHVAEQVQAQAHARVAEVVSQSLRTVFDDPYEFKLAFEQKRGRTEARLVFLRGGHEIDPMGAAGGGVLDVASFALRLSCLLLARPPLRRILILDEPFRFVSREYRTRVRGLLETLSKELRVQFVIVTHMEEFRTGSVVEL